MSSSLRDDQGQHPMSVLGQWPVITVTKGCHIAAGRSLSLNGCIGTRRWQISMSAPAALLSAKTTWIFCSRSQRTRLNPLISSMGWLGGIGLTSQIGDGVNTCKALYRPQPFKSRLGWNVLVLREQVRWVVLCLQCRQSLEVGAIGAGRHSLCFVFRHEVDVHTTGGVWRQRIE